jgi:hypothetical protein
MIQARRQRGRKRLVPGWGQRQDFYGLALIINPFVKVRVTVVLKWNSPGPGQVLAVNPIQEAHDGVRGLSGQHCSQT